MHLRYSSAPLLLSRSLRSLANNICRYVCVRQKISPALLIWRASVASETLTGVTQSKVGDVCLFIYLYIWTYVCHRVFVLVMWSTPFQIALNRILWFIDQYPYHPRNWIVYRLNSFAGAVFLLELVVVVSQCALCHGYKPCATVFTWKYIVH